MEVILSRGKKVKFLLYEDNLHCRISRFDKGIYLGAVETNALVNKLNSLFNEARALFNSSADKIYHYHLGFGVYTSITKFRGTTYCDIRRWWIPPTSHTPVPTKTGIVLTEEDISSLVNLQTDIKNLFPSPIEPCDCQSTQPCRRCRPFDSDN